MPEMNITMIGGKRCGKTSVLAAMHNNFEITMASFPISIATNDYGTLDVLEAKYREAKNFFRERNRKKRTFNPDQDPTNDLAKYSFNVGVNGKKGEIILNFIDYPGEYIKNPQKLDEIVGHMASSRILVIAIDTPYMMEEEQRYDDIHNSETRVTELVKQAGFAGQDKGPGLVLFVPLKCERYKNDGRMGEVTAQVKKSYEKLISYLQSSDNEIIMAITPIFTFGGAAFSRFNRDDDGEIELNDVGEAKQAIYYFPDMNVREPEPEHCEQPLLWILSFILRQAARSKADRNWLQSIFGGLWDSWLNMPSLDDYIKQFQNITRCIKTDGDGYYIF